MSSVRTPPRFVPTLTDVVQAPMEIPVLELNVSGDLSASELTQAQPVPAVLNDPVELEESIVHRVMQRVDVSLEQHLREAIAQVVQEQTRSLVPRLREEVETVVRQSVYVAVADELASINPGAAKPAH